MTAVLAARLVPTTTRCLNGVMQALDEVDAADRPDIQHVLGMARMVLQHLTTRLDPQNLIALATLDADIRALTGAPPATPQPIDYDEMVAQLSVSMDGLQRAMSGPLPVEPTVFGQAQELEARFYASLMPVPAAMPEGYPPLTKDGFEAYLTAKFPDKYSGLASFNRLVGGFQKETILVDARTLTGGVDAMVIRAEKNDRFVRFTASAIGDEYAIVRQLWEHGLPVAEPLWLEADEALLGRRFMVSRRAEGVNTGSAYGNSQKFPTALTLSFVETLARIHNQPIDAALTATELGKWTGFPSLSANTSAEIAAWRHQIWLDPAPASPTFSRVFDWLEANVPEDEAPARLLHNDFGPHNVLVEDNRVSAVLDWEVPRIGDPAEDLSFFIQCAGTAIDREWALVKYQELSGNHITAFRMAYFDVLSIGKVLVSTLSAAAMYQNTEPALIDWMQMPLVAHGAYQTLAEAKIAAAEAVRGT